MYQLENVSEFSGTKVKNTLFIKQSLLAVTIKLVTKEWSKESNRFNSLINLNCFYILLQVHLLINKRAPEKGVV
jgi:hypothetical protein